jgi:hypothetical protein
MKAGKGLWLECEFAGVGVWCKGGFLITITPDILVSPLLEVTIFIWFLLWEYQGEGRGVLLGYTPCESLFFWRRGGRLRVLLRPCR